jgi:hypothetical protein
MMGEKICEYRLQGGKKVNIFRSHDVEGRNVYGWSTAPWEPTYYRFYSLKAIRSHLRGI